MKAITNYINNSILMFLHYQHLTILPLSPLSLLLRKWQNFHFYFIYSCKLLEKQQTFLVFFLHIHLEHLWLWMPRKRAHLMNYSKHSPQKIILKRFHLAKFWALLPPSPPPCVNINAIRNAGGCSQLGTNIWGYRKRYHFSEHASLFFSSKILSCPSQPLNNFVKWFRLQGGAVSKLGSFMDEPWANRSA